MDKKLSDGVVAEAQQVLFNLETTMARIRSISNENNSWNQDEVDETIFLLKEFLKDVATDVDCLLCELEAPFEN